MTMKSPHVIWASVAIIAVLVGGVVALVLAGKDVDAIKDLMVLIAIPILSALGVSVYQKVDEAQGRYDAKLDQVKDATNGNTTKLLDTIKELNLRVAELALRVPVPPEPPALPPGPDDHTP